MPKRKGEKSVKRNPLGLTFRDFYLEGTTGLGSHFVMEAVPKREINLIREKKFPRNPDKKSIAFFSDKRMKLEFAYYKNTNNVFVFYQGHTHRGSIRLTAEEFADFILNLVKIYTIYYVKSKGLKRLRLLSLVKKLKELGKK